jgi:hypothetical protein
VSSDIRVCGCGELIHLVDGTWRRLGREDKLPSCRLGKPHQPASSKQEQQ